MDSISAAPQPVLVGSVEAISDKVCREMAIANGEIIDVDDDDEDNTEAVALPCDELIKLCSLAA